ncbi:ABC transporter substrate-binding protein [Salinibacterium sp. SYSU T00001]|uniref:ABC transporter substrate-binding protein n=1 Tax=Homoserinimonas sedimenticola TaxID=2986805 RepID=UPI0022359B58|nr:ABC transporter substrate-binding protein [Salinibacterium sedimenticola]MCW4385357.1 ABC transporter substrate-binding protein [Salinibacterium sedimenticola]
MKRSTAVPAVAGAVVLAMTMASCASSSDAGETGEYVSGGTFIKATASEIGSLIPMSAVAPDEREMINYAYEAMVYATPDGEIVPWLAESWDATGTEVTFTLRDGITCSDGSDFTAEVAAANFNFHGNAENASFYFGSVVPEGTTAVAEGNDVTVMVPANDPFLLENMGLIEMVCQAGLDDPESLQDTTNGTGLFALESIEAQSTYTFQKRDDYTWGPQDVTSETVGLPDTIEIRIIPQESTTANLLLSGDINAGVVLGADRARLDGAGLEYVGIRNPVGEMLFNEREDRPTSDPLVREALVRAIDKNAAAEVIADGSPMEPISLVTKTPLLCVTDEPLELPEYDVERAGELLDEAGWELGSNGLREKNGEPLEIVFIYDAGTATHAPAAELVQEMWNELGITTELRANDAAAWSEQLYSTFDWDTGWIQISSGGPLIQHMFYGGETPDNGGYNFMFVENPEYEALAQQAMTASPEETCDYWQQAEKELIERVDVAPLADNILPTYMNGAVFEQPGYITPTSIRMLG